MKGNIFLAVGACLFLVGAARAQNFLTVNETESKAILQEKTAEISLVVENRKNSFTGNVALELLDIKNAVRSKTTENRKIKSGRETLKIPLPLFNLMRTAQDENLQLGKSGRRRAREIIDFVCRADSGDAAAG